MANNKNENQRPLTLDGLATYNQEVLFPALEERLVTKREFQELRGDVSGLKREFKEFKNETLTNQDAMLKKLDILLTEKTVREEQERREKKLWAIIIKALREREILSPKDLEEIAKLEIF